MDRLPEKDQRNAAVLSILAGLIFCLGWGLPTPARCDSNIAEELISLEIKNQPLGEVLDDISAETGYHFNIDESWYSFPVTATFKNEPLHRGLKRILRNLNTAVIYGSDKVINIRIYGREKSGGQTAGQPGAVRSDEDRENFPAISGNPPARNPRARLPNQTRPIQADEQDAPAGYETDSETDTVDDRSEEAEEQDASDAGDADGSEQEDVSEDNEEKAVETESGSETSADSTAAGNE